MGISIGGGRPRAATHKPIELTRLMKLSGLVSDAATDGVVTADDLDELAEDEGLKRSHLYAAAVLCDDVEIATPARTTFVVCAGGCQKYGALDRIEDILSARESYGAEVNVVVRNCIDRCNDGPAIELRSADGAALLPRATAETIREALSALSDG